MNEIHYIAPEELYDEMLRLRNDRQMDFLESLTYRAQDLGRLSGVEFAEGFTTEKLLAFKNFDGIIL